MECNKENISLSSLLFSQLRFIKQTDLPIYFILICFFLLECDYPDTKKCGPNEFKCHNKLCIHQDWLCDNVEDCLDGSDEGGPEFCCKYILLLLAGWLFLPLIVLLF